MKKIILYTDGACSGNPGIGGWGCILDYNGKTKELCGANPNTTNNQMELTAVIEGLLALKEPCEVDVYSDSAYVVNAFLQGWLDSWQQNNWRTSGKKEVKNIELWQKLIELCNKHKINWHKVKGHADNERNNRCDFLATNQIEVYKKNNGVCE
ncbi:MAG: ribonuclease HI [Clostridia bacterium]|nr:ribonuclease HI [Clostridia bacterium]